MTMKLNYIKILRLEFEYKTTAAPVADILLKEKGSKFIGFAFPVDNEADLKKA